MRFLSKIIRDNAFFAATVLLFCWNSFSFMLPLAKTIFLLLKHFCWNQQPRKLQPVNNFATMGDGGRHRRAFFCWNRHPFLLQLDDIFAATGNLRESTGFLRARGRRCCARRPPCAGDAAAATGAVTVETGTCNYRDKLLHSRSR